MDGKDGMDTHNTLLCLPNPTSLYTLYLCSRPSLGWIDTPVVAPS